MKDIVLIPTYEPDENVIELVTELSNEKIDIIVINDGSSLQYHNIFKKIKSLVKLIEYDQNKGKGYAIKKGLRWIKDNYHGDYFVVTMDSDGQHRVEDAKKLLEYVHGHPDELAIGKRLIKGNTPIRSKLGNIITRIIYRITTGIKIYDTQTGLRAFSNSLIDYCLNINGERYEYEMNILLNARINMIKINEIEIQTVYIDNNSNSHFNTIKDSMKIYKSIIMFSLSSIFCFLIDYLCYILFFITSSNVILSNISARIISATLNYNLNRKYVFNSSKKIKKSALEYFLLALIIIILNTSIINFMIQIININVFIAKIFTEIILFIFSYIIQNKLVFRGDNYSNETV